MRVPTVFLGCLPHTEDRLRSAIAAFPVLLIGAAAAQSDPAEFSDVYNIGDVPPGSLTDVPEAITGAVAGDGNATLFETEITPGNLIADSLGQDAQLNLFDGGTLSGNFSVGTTGGAGAPSELNIFGGELTGRVLVDGGATLNILGGKISEFFSAAPGTTVNISGGTFLGSSQFSFTSNSSGVVNMSGGTLPEGLEIRAGGTLSMTGGVLGVLRVNSNSLVSLSGGTIQGTLSNDGDTLLSGDVEIGVFSNGSGRFSMRGGNIRNLLSLTGGSGTIRAGNFGRLSVLSGGSVLFIGNDFRLNNEAAPADLSSFGNETEVEELFTGVLADGTVFILASDGISFLGLDDRVIQASPMFALNVIDPSENPGTLSTGTFSKGVRAGETLTVSGDGMLSDNFAVVSGTLNLFGGSAGQKLEVAYGEVNIDGAEVGRFFGSYTGSTVNMSSGTVGDDAFVGGVFNLSSGTVGEDMLIGREGVLNISGGTVQDGLRSFGTVNLSGGVIEGGFDATGVVFNMTGGELGISSSNTFSVSEINIAGGLVIGSLRARGSINISGGLIQVNGAGQILTIERNSELTISGGVIERVIQLGDDTTAEITGGIMEQVIEGSFRNTVTMSGGQALRGFDLGSGSSLEISGGFIGGDAIVQGTVTILASSFVLNGEEITDLAFLDTLTFEGPNTYNISGVFADGSAFDDLTVGIAFSGSLNLTLIPAPGASLAVIGAGVLSSRRRRRA